MSRERNILEIKEISKAFLGVQALDKVSISINKGEVRAVVGENGAGESTLMKILLGIYSQDGREIFYKGQKVKISNPRALNFGISVIHQELSLSGYQTVAENI